jgi:TetR/AcrR family transcriptional regulator, ethionamide resistance regulator
MTAAGKATGAGGRRRTPSKGDRRESALLDALEDLLAEGSVADLSVDRIASRAGVSRTAFYFYFPSKEAALTALVERVVEAIWQGPDTWLTGDGDPRAELDRAIGELTRAWTEHRPVLNAMVEAAAYDRELWRLWREQMDGFIAASAARIARDAERGLTREGLDGPAVAGALCWMNERYCYAALGAAEGGAAPDEVRRLLVDVWYRTIYAE